MDGRVCIGRVWKAYSSSVEVFSVCCCGQARVESLQLQPVVAREGAWARELRRAAPSLLPPPTLPCTVTYTSSLPQNIHPPSAIHPIHSSHPFSVLPFALSGLLFIRHWHFAENGPLTVAKVLVCCSTVSRRVSATLHRPPPPPLKTEWPRSPFTTVPMLLTPTCTTLECRCGMPPVRCSTHHFEVVLLSPQ